MVKIVIVIDERMKNEMEERTTKERVKVTTKEQGRGRNEGMSKVVNSSYFNLI